MDPIQLLWLLAVFIYCEGSPSLLFANRKDIRLVDAQARRKDSSIVVVSHLEDAVSLDFYFAEKRIFWADVGLEEIKGMIIHDSKSNRSIVSTGLIAPDGIACDWLGKKLYWIDSETNRIEVSNFDGSHRKVLFWKDLDQPRALALFPLNSSWMFWTDWGEVPKIEKAGMDGNHESRKVIINKDIMWPNGITVEYDTKRIYWADAKLRIISSSDFNGDDRQIIASDNLPHPFAITLHRDMLYWTDWQTRAVHSCNKTSGCAKRTTFGGFLSPMGIHVYHQERQPFGITPCDVNNGGCSHLCLLAPNEPFYSCACPTGIRISNDSKTCSEGPEEILLLVRRSDLRRISLDTPDYTDVVLELDNIKHAIAIDYDPVGKMIYWTDDEALAIRRAFLNGTGQKNLIMTEVHHPDGIAVDWIARNLYWTDTGTDRIEVSRLNGSSRRILINENLDEPRAIVLDPEEGYMYWTDWGRIPKIEKAALDGSQRTVLIDTNLGWPNGLAIDFKERKLYWGDAKKDKIEMANFDGSDRLELISDQLPHIFGCTVLGSHIYWTDWQRRSIERVNKITGLNREVIIDQLPDLMGLKAINVNRIHGTNPCAYNNGNCSHLCLNKPGNEFLCACPVGLELDTDNTTCIVPEAFLLFSRKDNIRRISLQSNNYDIIPVSGVQEANALDYDINDHRIYWTDAVLKKITRAFMNGSNVEPVIEFGLIYPEGMAFDWVAHNLYWTDMGSHRIEVSRSDGSSRKVLLWKQVDDPRSLVLDPTEGWIYWSDWGGNCRIERAAMDGSNRKLLIGKLGRPNGLTIDYLERRLYWIDINALKIESSDLSGNNRAQIIGENLFDPYGLTQYEDYIYWTDWKTNSIERANKTNGENRTLIQKNLDHVMDLLVFHTSRQSGWNPCAVNNGGCGHLCLALPSSVQHKSQTHMCSCPTHYDLKPDNTTCTPPTRFLLYSQKNLISRVSIDGDYSPDFTLPIHGLKNVKELEYDPLERMIYWIDGRAKTIKKSSENGKRVSVVLNQKDMFHPYDMALDTYSRVLYWSCSQSNVINATTIEGYSIGTVVGFPNDRPRHIALHTLQGLLFWTNMVHSPRIEVSALDGKRRRVLFATNLEHPTALAVDMTDNLLFWADSTLKRIESSSIDGSNRKTIISSELLHPLSLTVLGNALYWVDPDQQVVEKINKFSGENRQHIQIRVSLLTDVIAVNKFNEQQFSNHPCVLKNGGCSHLCIALGIGRKRCSCPVNLVLSTDETTCVEIPICPVNEFRCVSGVTCIPDTWRCDGVAECEDMSDEMNCPTCKEHQFRCRNGDCIDMKLRCDGSPECQDYTDEECCHVNEFFCSNADQCINSLFQCDGKKDCEDGSDDDDGHCEFLHAQNHTMYKSKPTYSAVNVVLLVLVAFIVVFVIVGILIWKRKENKENENGLNMMMSTSPLNPRVPFVDNNGSRIIPPQSNNSEISTNAPSPYVNNLWESYDRNRVTGASSSSSSAITYAMKTPSPPPPSVVTDLCEAESLQQHMLIAPKSECKSMGRASWLTSSNTAIKFPNPSSNYVSNPHSRTSLAQSHHSVSDVASSVPYCNSSNCQRYNLNHSVAATSSSSSSSGTYPIETLNPPPSLVNLSSRCGSPYYKPLHSAVHPYQHYLSRNKPPPPTECGTDVESCYDSDPFSPPPPTPRSHCSEENYDGSCPPSPSTEKSFYGPRASSISESHRYRV